jgi:hypothetical protein
VRFADLDLLSVGHTLQLVGAIYQDEDASRRRTLLCFFPEDVPDGEEYELYVRDASGDHLDYSLDVLEMTLPEWERFIRQADVLDVEALVRRPDGAVVKAIVRKSQRQVEQGVSWAIFRRDGYRCRYCGRNDVPLTVDHLVLWEEGGPSTVENLFSSCRKCNKVRGNTPYAEWLKHPYYSKVSQNLSAEVVAANAAISKTLETIPRQAVRSR